VRNSAGSEPPPDAPAPAGGPHQGRNVGGGGPAAGRERQWPHWAHGPHWHGEDEFVFGPGRWRGGRRGGWMRGPRTSGPLRRAADDRLAGGVAAGLAGRLGVDPTVVRLVFVVATFVTGGYAAVAYVIAWLAIPAAGTDSAIAAKVRFDRRGLAVAIGLGSVLILILIGAAAAGVGWLGSLAPPLLICLAGIVLLWRNAPTAERATMRDLIEPLNGLAGREGRSGIWVRVLIAVVLLLGGAATLWSTHRSLLVLKQLGAVALIIAAVVILFGPWWMRIARDLVTERQARIRAEERAEMAARIHDSVLQTLALIQRRADQPQRVVHLARAQERELRGWLFGGSAPGSMDGQATTLAAGIQLIQQEVEASHGITVEAVTVGDCDLDDGLNALLAAAREATVNAAKWSGADVVALFAEVEPGSVSLFVRDRGRGFDPAAVPADRKGLAESIRARMARHGGSATVRTAPGEGTEVSLTMPRASRERKAARS
jgi:signal transduction histidine kinase